MKVIADLPGQAQRRQDYLAAIRRHHRPYFNDDGSWRHPTRPADNREWVWDLFAWVEGDARDVEFASRLVLHAPELRAVSHGSGCGELLEEPYNIFSCTHAIHLLAAHGGKFSPQAHRRLEQWARRTITDNPGGARADLQFHGYNDNMPSKATLGLILGGEYFDCRRAVEHGLWNLHQLRLLLARRGVIAEHCSPTYSPLTLTNLTEIVHYARDTEARELAAACCTRIWAELLAHYHAPSHSIAGPYARAYSTDSAGHLSQLHYLLWQVFGSGFVPNPMPELFAASTPLIVHHRGDHFFTQANNTFLAACLHEPPANLLDWLERRTFPFRFAATTERGEGPPWGEFSAGRVTIQLYQTDTFALGTSQGDWTQQSERWHLAYRRTEASAEAPREPAYRDARQLTVRYLVNDLLPGVTGRSPRGDESGEVDLVPEHADYHTLQHDNLALVAARPFASLAGRPIHRMGLAIVVPEHVSTVDELRIEDDHIWLQDGPFMLMVCPLGTKRWSADTAKAEILHSGAYRLLFIPNYQGPERTFTLDELRATTGAFVSAAASREEIRPEDFREAVRGASMHATTWVNQGTLQWHGLGHSLEMSYGLISNRLRYAIVDGEELVIPPWRADGLPREALPLAGTGRQPNPYPFPYREDADGWKTFPSYQFHSPSRRNGVSPAESKPGPLAVVR